MPRLTEGVSQRVLQGMLCVQLGGGVGAACVCMQAKSLQLCPTLCDPIDRTLPGCSVHGTLQARILESVAMLSSRGSSKPRD